ncbi:MAG TPA: TPM domain-containing protein [Vicinamibacterales bacterium]
MNDFANVIDPENAAAIDNMSRALTAASGDVVVVATVPDIDGYGDIREYANKLFENHGKGIGDRGKDNGLLIVLALKERQVWVEVGYDLEQWITDGFAGETSRLVMVPAFRSGDYGTGLRAGTTSIVTRIAQGRNVTLPDGTVPRTVQAPAGPPIPFTVIVLVFFAILMIGRIGRRRRQGIRRWGRGPWSGWSSGVGPFGGGFGGGFDRGGGGGGFGGGFGGFGGGRSGGGGGGAGW